MGVASSVRVNAPEWRLFMRWLMVFEIKKVLQKKSTWIAFLLLFVLQTIMAFAGNLGTTYVNDTFLETHRERNAISRKYGLELSGRVIDTAFVEEILAANEKIDRNDNNYLLSDVYHSEVRKYDGVYGMICSWMGGNPYHISASMAEQMQSLRSTDVMQSLDLLRKLQRESAWEQFGLTNAEKEYWMQKEEKLPRQFTYQYADAYDMLTDMTSGSYMTHMMMAFLIAFIVGNIFMEEHSRKTDQLLLCTKYGRQKLYAAKILAGCGLSFMMTFLFWMVNLIGNLICFGPEGFSAAVQTVKRFWYSYDLSVGEVFLIESGLLFLASLLIGILTMVLSEALHNHIASLSIVIVGLFAARLVTIPLAWRMLSMLWNCLPINLLKTDQGFLDIRLFGAGGFRMTTWQAAPIFWLLISAALVLAGRFLYCKGQIKGR